MSNSKVQITGEHTNLARVAQMILGPCTYVLRDVLRVRISPSKLKIQVKSHVAKKKKPELTKSQIALVYAEDYSKFDVTLVCLLLRNMCSIPPHSKKWGNNPDPGDRSLPANIDRIRLIRNGYGHDSERSIPDSDFNTQCKDIYDIVLELEKYLSSSTIYHHEVKFLETCPMDPVQSEKNIEELLRLNEKIEVISEEIDAIKKTLSTRNGKETQPIKDTLKQWQEDDNMFVVTKACKEVEQLIENQNLVIVTGHSGSGKSAIIQHIALKYRSKGWIVNPVHKVKDIIKLYQSDLQSNTIFVLHDPIGKGVFDELAHGSWERYEEILNVCLKENKLLISCRKYVLIDERVRGILNNKSNILDINDDKHKLNKDEKRNIFNVHACGNEISEETFAELVEIDEYFPLLCKLYFSKDRKQNDDLLIFFKEPITIVEEEIRRFRISCKEKYCALVLVALLKICPSVDNLREDDNYNEKFQLALELCGMEKCTQPHIIGDALKTLNGYFVKTIGDKYQFYHDFVMEVTTFVFGTDYQTAAIENADISFLRKRIRIKSSIIRSEHFTISVEENLIHKLGDRLFAELFGERFLDVVLNPCLKNEKIARIFLDKLNDNPGKLMMLLDTKEPKSEYRELDKKRTFNVTKLSFLNLESRISPLFALIVYSTADLALRCLKVLDEKKVNLSDKCLFSAICCNGSLDLFQFFAKDTILECLSENWGNLSCIHTVSLFHNYEILQEILQRSVDVNLSFGKFKLTPLMLAVSNSTVENENKEDKKSIEKTRNKTVQLLLNKGANVNECTEDGVSPLLFACSKGHESTVELLLKNGAEIDLCEKNGVSPLNVACEKGYKNIVRLLLQNKSDINLCEKKGLSPLSIASQNGHENIVQILLSNKADIELCAEDGTTPLLLACQNGQERIVHFLLDKKANINLCAKNGTSPLFKACKNGHESIVRFLLSKKADINLCTNNGYGPLSIACQNGHENIVTLLLSNEANANLCEEKGESPLFIACQNGHEGIVQRLLNDKADVNLCAKNGVSPLFIACQNGYDSVVQRLLNKETDKADINLCEDNGFSPLSVACLQGLESTVELLLNNEADVDLCKGSGKRPLSIACYIGHENIVKLLLNNKADINQCEKNGESPLYIACENGYEGIVELLLNDKADKNLCAKNGASPLLIACQNGEKSVVQLLLSKKADVNLSEEIGLSPLCIACLNGHEDIVEILLSNKADINLRAKNGVGPLYIACENGYESIVQLLLNNISEGDKADIDLCEENGVSPLLIACQNGHKSIVEILLDKGADIDLCTKGDASPLLIACQKGHENIVHVLLNKGADINLRDENGRDPLTTACIFKHANIIQILVVFSADIDKS